MRKPIQYLLIADRVEMSVYAVNDLRVENWNLVGMRCWYYVRYARSRAFVGITTIDTTLNHFLEIADCLEGVEDWTV
jgi:hypothetical protein